MCKQEKIVEELKKYRKKLNTLQMDEHSSKMELSKAINKVADLEKDLVIAQLGLSDEEAEVVKKNNMSQYKTELKNNE